MNLRNFLITTCLLTVGLMPITHASGKKDTPATVSFHLETEPTDNPRMIFQQAAGGKMRIFTRVPEVSTKDILSFAPFPADDGSYGILISLKDHAAKRLAAVTNIGQGRYLLSLLNGRVVDGVLIDKPVEDGKLVIWKGATLADIAILDESYPRIGQEGQKKKKKSPRLMLRSTLTLFLALLLPASAGIDLRLPTENHHLFSGKPDRFYMYVDRIFEGETSKPWLGGAYGFVRTAQRINGDVLLTKFHEGIDIAPIKRDKAGNPLDLVTSIADGRVVHVSPLAGRSNYGKYLVVEHNWDNSRVYSLYAHLAEITCQPGDTVRVGGVLGRMGYTGAGINRVRAHLHLEIAFQSSLRFDDWMKNYGGGINHHGNFNGMNLIGCDVAGFFLAHNKNPEITFSQFITSAPAHFKVAVPNPDKSTPDFLKRYPWLRKGPDGPANSWHISFSSTGQPIAFEASPQFVDAPVVVAVRPAQHPHRYLTRNLITGDGNRATLTSGGKSLVALVTDTFPTATASNP